MANLSLLMAAGARADDVLRGVDAQPDHVALDADDLNRHVQGGQNNFLV